MHAALAHGDTGAAVALLGKGGRLRARPSAKGGAGPPPAGDAIDRAPAEMRRAILDEDEKRKIEL